MVVLRMHVSLHGACTEQACAGAQLCAGSTCLGLDGWWMLALGHWVQQKAGRQQTFLEPNSCTLHASLVTVRSCGCAAHECAGGDKVRHSSCWSIHAGRRLLRITDVLRRMQVPEHLPCTVLVCSSVDSRSKTSSCLCLLCWVCRAGLCPSPKWVPVGVVSLSAHWERHVSVLPATIACKGGRHKSCLEECPLAGQSCLHCSGLSSAPLLGFLACLGAKLLYASQAQNPKAQTWTAMRTQHSTA